MKHSFDKFESFERRMQGIERANRMSNDKNELIPIWLSLSVIVVLLILTLTSR